MTSSGKCRTFLTAGLLLLAAASLINTAARGDGSHEMAKICAKADWSYKPKATPNKTLSQTSKEYCGQKYRQTHGANAQKTQSEQTACQAALKEAPKLSQGDTWVNKPRCKSYEVKS